MPLVVLRLAGALVLHVASHILAQLVMDEVKARAEQRVKEAADG